MEAAGRGLTPSVTDPMATTQSRGPREIYGAFQWSMKGLRAAWKHEASFRLEVYLLVVLFPLGLWLGNDAIERVLLCGCMLPVLAMELINSAVEAVVDKVSPEFNELAGRAKDLGSAAVFMLLVNVVVCWALVLWPRLHSS